MLKLSKSSLHCFLFSIFYFNACMGLDISDHDLEEIEIPCHCLNNCDRENMCDWVYKSFLGILETSPDMLPTDLKSLQKQKFSLIELTDGGELGCFTTFGLLDGEFIRTDVGVTWGVVTRISGERVEKVPSIPSLSSRRDADVEDFCIFRLP